MGGVHDIVLPKLIDVAYSKLRNLQCSICGCHSQAIDAGMRARDALQHPGRLDEEEAARSAIPISRERFGYKKGGVPKSS